MHGCSNVFCGQYNCYDDDDDDDDKKINQCCEVGLLYWGWVMSEEFLWRDYLDGICLWSLCESCPGVTSRGSIQ